MSEMPSTKYHLVVFQQPDGGIYRSRVNRIQSILDDKITTPPDATEIDVWLESPGGDAHAAYKLVLDLRSRCHRLQAVVPDYAKSAATLMLLGFDRIYMDAAAELGPLDVQIEHPLREGEIVSGLNIVGALEFLSETGIRNVCIGSGIIVRMTRLPRHEVAQSAFHFMAELLQPIASKLDPHLLHQASKQLEVASEYAQHLMKDRKLPPELHLDPGTAAGTISRLVKDYPAHEFVISRAEARSLKLPIENADKHPRWERVKRFHRNFQYEDDDVIMIVPDTEFDKMDAEEKAEASGEMENESSVEQPNEINEPNETSELLSQPRVDGNGQGHIREQRKRSTPL